MALQSLMIMGYGGVAAPTLPAFTSAIAAYGVNNFNPSGYPAGIAASVNDFEANMPFLGVTPYAADWTIPLLDSTPPFLVDTWDDQNSNANDLVQSGGARPLLNYAAHTVDFDGSSQGIATAANVTLGVKFFTLYVRFKAGSLAETSILFESGSGATGNAGIVRLSLVAGVLTASVSDQTAVVSLLNTKIKTISDTNWHIATVIVDTTLAAASQVTLLVDNSATGVTAPISTNLASENLTTAKFNVGARNNAASAWFTGSMSHLITFSVAQNSTLAGQWYAWINSLAFTPSSVLVAGAGTSAANGIDPFFGIVNGRAAYTHGASGDPTAGGVYWSTVDAAWEIYDAGVGDVVYTSFDDVAFPWLAATWEIVAGDAPAPVVTQGGP